MATKTKVISLLVSLALTLFLFYIDGGFSFSWMNSIGNWICYMIYIPAIFCLQSEVYKMIRSGKRTGKTSH